MNIERLYLNELQTELTRQQDILLAGKGIGDFAKYQKQVGVVRGLTLALQIFEDILKPKEED